MGGAGEDIQVAAAVLSKRYEEQLFSQASNHSKGTKYICMASVFAPYQMHTTHAPPPSPLAPPLPTVVPALVITGFLGSGKTTTVQHLLATTG